MTDNNDSLPDAAGRGRREGGWDMRVAFLADRQRWWWSAWNVTTSTELYGFVDSPTQAWTAMHDAIRAAAPTPPDPAPPTPTPQ